MINILRISLSSIVLCCILFNTVSFAAGKLPDSLSSWYKPENKRQIWLHTMFSMRREIQAVEEYSAQGDIEGVNKWSAKLAKHYRSLPQMVPEWKSRVKLELVDYLELAAKNSNFSKVVSLTQDMTKTCRNCHRKFRTLAALKFRSADFSIVDVKENGQTVEFEVYKDHLTRTMNRIKISAVDGYWDKAFDATGQLKLLLSYYGETCSACHKDEVPYERILGASTQSSFDDLLEGIENKDIKKMGGSLGSVAVKVCARCHGVHRTLSELRSSNVVK